MLTFLLIVFGVVVLLIAAAAILFLSYPDVDAFLKKHK